VETILLVEDSKFLRIATERALVKAGYHVICAVDGEEALAQANDPGPQLIILDMLLPKISGPEVLQKLKASPATAKIPVLVLSSLSQKNVGKLMHDGAAGFLEKGPLLDDPSC
jgi:two-component system, chemotaxis family, sensor kinase CheA